MYPDVRNAEVTHLILYLINGYLIETQKNLFTYIPLANKDMFSHENMTRCHVQLFFIFYRNRIKLSQTILNNRSDFIHDIEPFLSFLYPIHLSSAL